MTVTERIIPRNTSKKSKQKPTVITWGKTSTGQPNKMLRSQSINACVNDIYESSRSMGFIKINLIGASGSGKSTLAEIICHQLHKRDETFEVHYLQDSDLINFKETIQNLSKNNQILAFDDLSGLVANFGKTALEKLESEITTIRHIDQNEDRKIIMLLNFHAQKKLSKFLRISNFTFYTDCQNEEIGYLEELLGKGQKQKIIQFAKLRSQSRMYHKFSFQLSRGNNFTYNDGDPFRLLLYNNTLSTRFVVSPQLSWILDGEICQKCHPSEKTIEAKVNLETFRDDFSKKFGKGIAKRAIELKLLRQGFYTQPKRVMQAEKYMEQFFAARKINLEALAELYGLKERTTKLFPDKQPVIT
jgi:ATPase subunit of ABC transporter with duplicated ATPase domains